jgi:hypothetical protein
MKSKFIHRMHSFAPDNRNFDVNFQISCFTKPNAISQSHVFLFMQIVEIQHIHFLF